MQPVIVPYISSNKEVDGEVEQLLIALRHADQVGGIARKVQRYLVQIPAYGLQALLAAGAIHPVNEEKFGDQFLELVSTNLYDPDCGLSWDNPEFISAESSIL